MKIKDLSQRQRLAGVLGGLVVLLLIVAAVVVLGGDDSGDDSEAAGSRPTTTEAGSDDDAATTPEAPDGDAAKGASTTTAPSTSTTEAADGGGGSDGGGTDGGGTNGAGSNDGGAEPAPPPDPPGRGQGANQNDGGEISPDDAQSPPARIPGATEASCGYTGPPKQPLRVTDGPSGDGGQWVTVGYLEGDCGGTSGGFTTRGVDTRLVFRSDAEQMIVFVRDLDDPSSNGGFADVECRGPCANTRILTNRGGPYKLEVIGVGGPWTVALQEYTR